MVVVCCMVFLLLSCDGVRCRLSVVAVFAMCWQVFVVGGGVDVVAVCCDRVVLCAVIFVMCCCCL